MAELEAEQKAAKELERESRAAYEEEKNEAIQGIAIEAEELLDALQEFKNFVFDKLNYLISRINEGNPDKAQNSHTFKTADGKFKVEFARQLVNDYDERSGVAVKLISEFVSEKYAQDAETQELVLSLLERRNGNLDPKLVQKLYAMEDRFDDDKWKRGLQLLRESYKVADTKEYVRFFRKTNANAWEGIKLDFAVLPVQPLEVETVEENETEEGGADGARL